MLDYISLFPSPHEDEINEDFLMHRADRPIEDFIIDAMKEFERIKNIEILSSMVIYDQDEVDLNYYMVNINYKKKDLDSIEFPKIKQIADSRYGEVRFKIKVTTNLNERIIEKRILMPMMDDNGFYVNNGKKMKAIKQLVDASIYSQRGKITLKSKMPTIIYCNRNRVIEDIDGVEHTVPSFSYALEPSKSKRGRGGVATKKKVKFVNPLMIYMSKMGFTRALSFFGMNGIVDIVGEISDTDKEDNYIFQINDIYVIVKKHFFDVYEMVQAFTCMCTGLKSKNFPVALSNLEDKEYWICRIGYIGSLKNNSLRSFYEKGMTMIYMVEQLLNRSSIHNLRLPLIYKENVYYLMYWMITNFDALKSRNNIDMKNKRVRVNEYIVDSSLGKKINENINKFIEVKSKSRMNTIDTLLELFNFGSDIIVNNMRNLNDLLKSDELVNDLTFLQDLAYSAKGPNSLGEGSPNSIADKYRYLHESMVGVIDLFDTSNSNYGLSGYFTPFVKTYDGFYFTPEREPCTARYLFDKALVEKEGLTSLYDISSPEAYFDDMYKKAYFDDDLRYEELEIVEKEEDNTQYTY